MMREKQYEVDTWIRQFLPCLICEELFARRRLWFQQEIGMLSAMTLVQLTSLQAL